MSASSLILHRGAREVSRTDLDGVTVPTATATWFPISHGCVLDRTVETLTQAGFEVARSHLGLTRHGTRFFATLDLQTPVVPGVTLAVGIRNSIDRSLPISFCAGSRVLVCSNLAFRSEIVVSRKHTKNGQTRFNEAIARAVQTLHQYRDIEADRIRRFQLTELTPDAADAILLRVFERQIITAPLLPRVIHEWRQPSFEDFQPRTLWSLFNACTAILAERQQSNPQLFSWLTIRLHDLFDAGGDSENASPTTVA